MDSKNIIEGMREFSGMGYDRVTLKEMALLGDGLIGLASAEIADKLSGNVQKRGPLIGRLRSNKQLSRWTKRHNASDLIFHDYMDSEGVPQMSSHMRATIVEAYLSHLYHNQGVLRAMKAARLIALDIFNHSYKHRYSE